MLSGDSELYWSFDESDKNPKSESEYVGLEAYQNDTGLASNYIPENNKQQRARLARSVADQAGVLKTYEAVDPTNEGTLYLTVKGLSDQVSEFEINVQSGTRAINSGQCLASGLAIFVTLFLAILTLSFDF